MESHGKSKTGLKVKHLKFNNGGRYGDENLNEFCVANGIKLEKTIPKTPQHNGIVQRMNKTLNEHVKSMRIHAGLPKMFWAKVVSIATYLINHEPLVPFGEKLPKEV